MIADCDIRLAVPADAASIAIMSRDFVEHGLGWRWTPARVLHSVRDKATNVVVCHEHGKLAGFGIMKYHDEEAFLFLLAVTPTCRGRGIGTAMMSWLETSALTAGIGTIYLEARVTNAKARGFYRKLGYQEIAVVPRYYQGQEDAVRIGKDLWR